jgi:hypothetical protein
MTVVIALAGAAILPAVGKHAYADIVIPSVANNLVCHYDFDHPNEANADLESDVGLSGTALHLVNGGTAMRVADPAYPGAGQALQTQQIDPTGDGKDDWKAGVFEAGGVSTLRAFAGVQQVTLMGWVKPTGNHPRPNTMTGDPGDVYNAIGLFGILSGNSDGHNVRALLEIINVDGVLRLVALGRRNDDGNSLILAANDDWEALLPTDTWTHLAATFDFDEGTMALYHNGWPLAATYTSTEDRWRIAGDPEPDRSSYSNPAGIKIGGSFPQNSSEKNAFNGRFDDLMFLDRALSPAEILGQFENFGVAGNR